jgi:hypothetical protein
MNRSKLARILIEEGLTPASAARKTAGPEKIEVGDRVAIQTRKGKVGIERFTEPQKARYLEILKNSGKIPKT